MKTLLCCSVGLILVTASATARAYEPHELIAGATQKPPLELSEQQRRKI